MESLGAWERFWAGWVGAAFFKAYRQVAGTTAFLPSDERDLRLLTDAHLLRQAIGELSIELNYRPDWVAVALEAILELVNAVKPA